MRQTIAQTLAAAGRIRRGIARSRWGGFGALCLVLVAPLLLAGCMQGNRLAFAPPGEDISRPGSGRGRALTAVFGDGQLILAAPSGFCFDAQMEKHTATGGFALLADCARLSTFGRFRGAEGAMLTATVGAVAANTPAPSAEALRAAFTTSRRTARVLETRSDRDLPLVKLHMDGHSAEGASGTHWRGAFVVHGHLVSVALYAPDGSTYLGEKGARLIREFVRASRNATRLAETTTPAAPGESAPEQTARPLSRPGNTAPVATASAAADPQRSDG
ncbi:hypothetical protein [Epibacterium sp. Ofav1-8]|uniref:hypothetical protein n=1 Tax=Epibacterium sp. Ofav1-8 TaxID=2917735 RepID=UPI001EF4B63A|nr:hypothetical protein [Epibacterium sp. Ofav1-8]